MEKGIEKSITDAKAEKIITLIQEFGNERAREIIGVSVSTWRRYRRLVEAAHPGIDLSLPGSAKYRKRSIDGIDVSVDKKIGTVDWREYTAVMQQHQDLHEKASWSQKQANFKLTTPYRYIVLKPLSDMHIGNMGVNYDRLLDFTDSLLRIPYLFCCLLGDETDNFVSFKNQLPLLTQVVSPAEQNLFVESWLKEIGDKILFSTWGNHGEFDERASGNSQIHALLGKNTVFFNGIGKCLLNINDVSYDIVATHCTRYGSSFNLCHGLKQMARKDAPDADIYLTGHVHQPDFEVSFERGHTQLFMVMGSLKERDTYSERYFSYFSSREDYAIVLDSLEHRFIPFIRLRDALEFAEAGNGKVA